MATRLSALTLYRSILRAHAKSLPIEMRSLGDAYVKSEFRLHKAVTNEGQLGNFFKEWEQYLKHIQETARVEETRAAGLTDSMKADFGINLDQSIEMTDEQKAQLQVLREEASNIKKN